MTACFKQSSEFKSRDILFAQSLKVPQVVLLPQLALVLNYVYSSHFIRFQRSPVKYQSARILDLSIQVKSEDLIQVIKLS